jgi:hypothetical protein
MIERILRAKHWQIFIGTFIIPYTLYFIVLTITKNDPIRMMNYSPFIILIFFLGLFGWFWSIAAGLIDKTPEGVKMKIRKFKIFLVIPMIYIPFAFSLMNLLFESAGNANEPSGVMLGVSFAIIFPLHILSMFGFLYSFYFVAKTFKTVELQREVAFSDFVGEFFLLLLFPIGVWIIQPKINKMID